MNFRKSYTSTCFQFFTKTILINFNNFFKNLNKKIKNFIVKIGKLIKKSIGIFKHIKIIIINFIINFTNKIVKLQNNLKKLNLILGLPLIYFIKFILLVRVIRIAIINKQWILNSYFVECLDFKNELSTFLNKFSLIYNYNDLIIMIDKNFYDYLIVFSIIILSTCFLILFFFNILIQLLFYLLNYFKINFIILKKKYI